MQLFIGYMIFLTFTIGLLIWVFLLKTQLNKKIKTSLSLVILCLSLIISIVFMSFLPFKWMNIVYYLGLFIGFLLLVTVVYIIVSLITKAIYKKQGKAVVDSNFKETFQDGMKKAKSMVNQAKKQASQKSKETKEKKPKNQLAKQNISYKKQKKETVKQPKDKKKEVVSKNKQKQSSKNKSKQQVVKQPSTKKVKPKDKKPQNRRMEDYEPPRESQVSHLKKPEKPNYGKYKK